MVLNWDGPNEGGTSEIEGYYFYVRHQKNIDLKGFSDSRTRGIYLKESYKGKPTGYMEFYQGGIDGATLGKYEEAIEACKQALSINPDFAEAHFNLGMAYINLNNRDSALEQYKILKNLDTEMANDLFNEIYK